MAVRAVPSADEQLLIRCAWLMDVLAEAQDEMAAALLLSDVGVASRACRRLSSVGWLFREAGGKHERRLDHDGEPVGRCEGNVAGVAPGGSEDASPAGLSLVGGAQ